MTYDWSNTVYEAVYEDLSNFGGPMGWEYTTEHSLGLFNDPTAAKAECAAYFKKRSGRTIVEASWKPYKFFPDKPDKEGWIRDGNNWRTQDLGSAMLRVKARRVK